jgi:hypothetical protein
MYLQQQLGSDCGCGCKENGSSPSALCSQGQALGHDGLSGIQDVIFDKKVLLAAAAAVIVWKVFLVSKRKVRARRERKWIKGALAANRKRMGR